MNKIIIALLKKYSFGLRSQGSSMEPLFYENDLLFFAKTVFEKLKISNIVLIKNKNRLISHRVIYKTKNYCVTKGDNNPYSDGKIFPHQIIGKVIKIKRNKQIFTPENFYLIQSSQYFQEIIKIKDEFEKKKINFIFLKGLPLHLYYEKSHPYRFYFDCDVMVDKKDFLKAEKILIKNGYKKTETRLSEIHQQIKDKDIENSYIKIINNFPVVFDLHLEPAFMMTQLGSLEALYPQNLIDQLTEELLKTKKRVKINPALIGVNNESFYLLSTNYLLLYLSLHLFHHNFRGAFRYQFLDTIIRKELRKKWEIGGEKLENDVGSGKVIHTSHFNNPASQFSLLTSLINKYRLKNFVYPVFVLLKKYYQTPIPSSFMDSINPLKKSWEVGSRKENHTSHLNRPASHLTVLTSILKTPIFDDEPRLRAGINRFINLFLLSPNPFWKKLLVFVNPQVVYSVLWIGFRRLFRKK